MTENQSEDFEATCIKAEVGLLMLAIGLWWNPGLIGLQELFLGKGKNAKKEEMENAKKH